MDKQAFITAEGLEKIQKELDELRTVKRKEIASRIQDAKELGDLSENAEYAEAKNEQSFTEGRIAELEELTKNATIIDDSKKNNDHIVVGSTITVETPLGRQTYVIVGSNEADPSQGRISNESPLGEALIGKSVGSQVVIETPKGKQSIRILEIS